MDELYEIKERLNSAFSNGDNSSARAHLHCFYCKEFELYIGLVEMARKTEGSCSDLDYALGCVRLDLRKLMINSLNYEDHINFD